jgi:hypothetical protein
MDTVLLKVPNHTIIEFLEADFKKDVSMYPLNDVPEKARPKGVNLTGPLYFLNGGVYTAEELSWALRKGYVRSEFYGHRCHITDEFRKPQVRYNITQKGLATRRWY